MSSDIREDLCIFYTEGEQRLGGQLERRRSTGRGVPIGRSCIVGNTIDTVGCGTVIRADAAPSRNAIAAARTAAIAVAAGIGCVAYTVAAIVEAVGRST